VKAAKGVWSGSIESIIRILIRSYTQSRNRGRVYSCGAKGREALWRVDSARTKLMKLIVEHLSDLPP